MSKIPTVKVVLINKNRLSIKVTVPGTTTYKFKNLDEVINLKYWNAKAGYCTSKHADSVTINQLIGTERKKLIEAFEQDHKSGIPFTEAHISNRLKGLYLDLSQDFYAFCTEQIKITNYKPESMRTYRSEVTKMQSYWPVLTFTEIDFKWLQGYEKWMRTGTKGRLPNHDNTVWKSLKFINTMLNRAIKVGGIIEKNPFKMYDRGKYKQGIPTYLEWSEAQKFHEAVKNKPLTEFTRTCGYYALLSFYSGLRFGDSLNFDYSKKVIEDTTGRRLVLYAAKNTEIVSIAFTSYISEIVDHIKDKPLKTTNQEFNAEIKKIVGMAEINKPDISSHSFRHGFAMRLAELGVGIDDVQKLLGHNKRSSTEIYFRIKNKRLDEAMKKWE